MGRTLYIAKKWLLFTQADLQPALPPPSFLAVFRTLSFFSLWMSDPNLPSFTSFLVSYPIHKSKGYPHIKITETVHISPPHYQINIIIVSRERFALVSNFGFFFEKMAKNVNPPFFTYTPFESTILLVCYKLSSKIVSRPWVKLQAVKWGWSNWKSPSFDRL